MELWTPACTVSAHAHYKGKLIIRMQEKEGPETEVQLGVA